MGRPKYFAVVCLVVCSLLTASPGLAVPQNPPALRISALHYYGLDGNLDEAVRLTNPTSADVTLDGAWSLRDQAGRILSFPNYTLGAGQSMWVANTAQAFQRQFGFAPALSYAQLSGPAALAFANDGGQARLVYAQPIEKDTANANGGGWDAGVASPTYRTMERVDSRAADAPSNWATADVPAPFAFDAAGNAVIGTPGRANSRAGSAGGGNTGVVINEVAWMGTKANSNHEWIELFNNGGSPVSLEGWSIRMSNGSNVSLAGTIAAQGYFVAQKNAATFSAGAQADLTASWSNMSNAGAILQLVDAQENIVDALVYGNGSPAAGWSGEPLKPYVVTNSISAEGQLLMRKPGAADTDTAQDWLSDASDLVNGRRAIYPGWDFEEFFTPMSAASAITLAIAPDASFETLSAALQTAQRTIDLETYSFDNAHIAQILAAKSAAGVRVRVLADGAPVGGLPDQELWNCQQITDAGNPDSGCWFMRSGSTQNARRRYKSLHAKFIIIDGERLVIGSENLGANGYPDDDKSDGTLGHRGVMAVVAAPGLISRAQAIFEADFDGNHDDITRWCAACELGAPPLGFVPITVTGGVSYAVRYPAPLVVAQPITMELATSPESNIRVGGLLAVLDAAGAGDEVLVQQLNEPYYWGASASNPIADPNLRLRAAVGAASRGARVRVMLDAYYSDDEAVRGNFATMTYLNALADQNGWDMRAILADPAKHGIHNKMFLARVGGRFYAQIGSWNGTEASAKLNREMTLLIESPQVYGYLQNMFEGDWSVTRPMFLPILGKDAPAQSPIRLLVSEVMFNPTGADETGHEWAEIYNPSGQMVDLSQFKLGDAETRGKVSAGEGMYAFPAGSTLAAGGVAVIAENAALFYADWGRKPDYELSDYDHAVPDMLSYTSWATGTMQLVNAGDQVLLLDGADAVMDAAQWLTDTLPGTAPFTATLLGGHSLQRSPPAQDSNNCAVDFRDQPIPSPGTIP